MPSAPVHDRYINPQCPRATQLILNWCSAYHLREQEYGANGVQVAPPKEFMYEMGERNRKFTLDHMLNNPGDFHTLTVQGEHPGTQVLKVITSHHRTLDSEP
jgi:hypothetical protein